MRVPQLDFPATVPALLRRAVEHYGDMDHVVSATDRLSFAEAERRSALLARKLLASGIGKGSRVGIAFPSSVDFEVAFLAVARIGAVAMLFSSTYRPAELAVAVRNGDVATLIAPRTLLDKSYEDVIEAALPELRQHTGGMLQLEAAPYLRSIHVIGGTDRAWATGLHIDADTNDLDGDLASADLLRAVEERVVPADLLLAIFTSGTSADPKAVLHTHGTAVRKVHPSTGLGLQPSNPGKRVLMVMPFFWVGGPQSLLGSLHSGSAIVCQERYEAEAALVLIERERVTHVAGWATLVQSLKTHPLAVNHDLSSLEVAPPMATMRSSKDDPINLGMTETFGMHRNREFFDYKIIDRETGEVLPDGVEGEFCVRGFGLTAGLYGREREEIFDADGYYHTGDRGYIENGEVYYTGRFSEMIKTAGANVSPLEVETALMALHGVDEAFVMGRPHEERGEEVVAVVVGPTDVELDPDALRAQLKERLSAYKIPSEIVRYEAADVPRLASGKPNKRLLVTMVGDQTTAVDTTA